MKYLKTQTLDIHAGGRDLIFPHHENEIAQAEAVTGKPFAKYWIHHGLLTINGQKMAKSLGNFVTIKDFIEKYQYPDILKLFFLSAHYSHPIDYTEEKIGEATHRLESISLLMGRIHEKLSTQKNKLKSKENNQLKEIKNKFISVMDEDFNTPLGLAAISDLVKITNKNIDNLEFISQAKDLWIELAKIFGLDYSRRDIIVDVQSLNISARTLDVSVVVISEESMELCKKRDEARKKGKFEEADKIRKELEKKGFIVEDTIEGTKIREKP
jgi:cysteinyl-tRNA synthetase